MMKSVSSAALLVCVASSLLAADRQVTISAGKVDRLHTPVTFKLPADIEPGPVELSSEDTRIEVQRLEDGRAILLLPRLKAGQSRTFTLRQAPMVKRLPRPTDMMLAKKGTSLTFIIGDKTVLTYNGDKTPLPEGFDPAFHRGGYIHPVITPGGKTITDDYPVKHKHHHGVWSPWTSTVFEGRKVDFWNMGQKLGTVEFVSLGGDFFGPIASGFSTKHKMVDLKAPGGPKAAIDENWDVTLYSIPAGDKPYYLFELIDTQNCAGNSPLILPKYHYGGLGFRGRGEWDGKDNCRFLTSEDKDRSNGNQSRGKWCWVGGKLDGQTAGIAILDHPSNFRHPQPMRIHPDEPFFCYAPSQLGEWKIEPGTPYVAKYRFVVTDGEPDKELIERLWNDFANPVEVTVK